MCYIKDNTVNSLKTVRNNTNLVLLFNDKDSSWVILDNTYKEKVNMVKKGLNYWVYAIEFEDIP